MRVGVRSPLVLTVLSALAAACVTSVSGATDDRVPVTKVTDGDTLHVTRAGRDERVRLIGIDTPEVPWYGGSGECFGVEAALFTRRRLMGRSVRLAFDLDRRDRFACLRTCTCATNCST